MKRGVSSSKALCFDPDALSSPNFNAQKFIAELRVRAPLRILRDDLRTHTVSLQSEVVSKLQTDFHTFSTLNETIGDVNTLCDATNPTLKELQKTLEQLLKDIDDHINALENTLSYRRHVNGRISALQTLIYANDLLHKCERLLNEYTSLPDRTTQEALRVIERIATETAQLNFTLNRAVKGAFLRSLTLRIGNVRRKVNSCLDAWLRRSLKSTEDSASILPRVLCMYVSAGIASQAEEFFRREVVLPFTSTRLQMTQMLNKAEKNLRPKSVTAAHALEAAHEEIVQFLGEKVLPIVSLCESEERLKGRLDFVGNAVWPQIQSAIAVNMAAAFSPGIPNVFHKSFMAGSKIYHAIEASAINDDIRDQLRSSKATVNFWKHWNLPVYFQLRFQEITSRFDEHLSAGPVSKITSPLNYEDWNLSSSNLLRTDVYQATPTASLVACLQRCWAEDVFHTTLTHRFLRLSLQLLARYSTWVRTGLAGEWSIADTVPKGAARIYKDIAILLNRIPSELSSTIRLRGASLSTEHLDAIESVFSDAVGKFSSLLPELTTSISSSLARSCVENLQPLRGILATYRMSSKQIPTTHSSFVPKILRPLKSFIKENEDSFPKVERIALATSVTEQTAEEYRKMATDLLQRNKSSEATLRRLNIGRSGALSGAHSNTTSVIEKISTQLFLDVEKFAEEASLLGVSTEESPLIILLRESVQSERTKAAGNEQVQSDSISSTTDIESTGQRSLPEAKT
ncbi:Conserved oligomeric Golgi complex subunit 2 [Gracilariopsis chorda]|uniref:Conserved oligomeric Golgi complex subunit 2 n=1 Tax=Gracilariopsis chorda TaxID=448386 RepID=A0A2V3J2Z1_9FLOR|nr:Conserved oligomeric Golgi complex subunit 2 [Gracilariopsis chorda]|eukprot:PXF48703.1 Conserved oligomeric Golgi complex subunit 2 [Gracilariopsis chorda]